jgi:hypothetical protein
LFQHFPDAGGHERRPACQQLIQNRSKTVNVRVGPEFRIRLPNKLGRQITESGGRVIVWG